MEHKVDDRAPDPSMLWLAIGMGVFSVFASFFLAIYSSTDSTGSESSATDPHALEAAASPAGQ